MNLLPRLFKVNIAWKKSSYEIQGSKLVVHSLPSLENTIRFNTKVIGSKRITTNNGA